MSDGQGQYDNRGPKFCSKCGRDPSSEGGFYFHNCPEYKVTAVPHPPTPKFSDAFQKPEKELTAKELQAKKERDEKLKNAPLGKLLQDMIGKARYPRDRASVERVVRGTSSAVLKEGERPASGTIVKGRKEIEDFAESRNIGSQLSEDIFGRAQALAEQGYSRKEMEEELTDEYAADMDNSGNAELMKMIVNSAMSHFEQKNAEDGVSDELDLVEVPEDEDEAEDAPYPERPDEPPLMKDGHRMYRGKKGGIYEIDRATGKKKYKHPKNAIGKGEKFGMPDLPVGGTGHFPRRDEDEEDEEKGWDNIPVRAYRLLEKELANDLAEKQYRATLKKKRK